VSVGKLEVAGLTALEKSIRLLIWSAG